MVLGTGAYRRTQYTSFLGELSKRLLKLPRWYSNTPASIVIGLGSARALCLTRKLNFFRKISSDDHSEIVSSLTLASLSDDICLSHECQDLEKYLHSSFTAAILQREADTCPHPREIKKDILSKDHDLRLAQCEDREDTSIIVEVERAVGWPKLWDLGLPDHGPKCIDDLRNLVRVITFPLHALSACCLCEEEDIIYKTLSFLMFLPPIQEVPVIATNSYHYCYQPLTDSVLLLVFFR